MKERLDLYLARLNLAPSREKARSLIMEGVVYVNNQKTDKAGYFVTDDDKVEVRGNTNPYVSRGGLKLHKAVNEFGIDLNDKISREKMQYGC